MIVLLLCLCAGISDVQLDHRKRVDLGDTAQPPTATVLFGGSTSNLKISDITFENKSPFYVPGYWRCLTTGYAAVVKDDVHGVQINCERLEKGEK